MLGCVPVGGGVENTGCGDDVRTVTCYTVLVSPAKRRQEPGLSCKSSASCQAVCQLVVVKKIWDVGTM